MRESKLEEIIIENSDELIDLGVSLRSRQEIFSGARTDLVFTDSSGDLIVVEVKKGQLSRSHIGQIVEYWPKVRERYPGREIRLMVVAQDIPYERRAYLEEFNIEFREISEELATALESKMPRRKSHTQKSREAKTDSAIYKTINSIRRGNITFGLKVREDLDYFTTVWRSTRPASGTNRRFYKERGAFWEMDLDLALEMIDEGHARGLLATKYSRWPNSKIQILDSSGIAGDAEPNLIEEILARDGSDSTWRESADLRIIACCEPEDWVWRKIMIYSKDRKKITFRSMTLSNDYKNAYSNINFAGGWKLDKAMMDADVVLSKIHFEILRGDMVEDAVIS